MNDDSASPDDLPKGFDFGNFFNNYMKGLPTAPLLKPVMDFIMSAMKGEDFKADIFFDTGNFSYLAHFNLNNNLGHNKAKSIIDAGQVEATKRAKRFHEAIKQSLLPILDAPSNLPMLINIELDPISEEKN